MIRPDPIFLGGPTAVGKSEVALRLAERVDGEIITVDSMQVYRGLDIGTAKPNASERRRVPHHLIDVVDLTAQFDAAQFVKLAREAKEAIVGRNKTPIFCGGTGLYFKAYLEGLGQAPAADPALRAELEQRPLAMLEAELKERDPVMFEHIDRLNRRRLIRALEVVLLSGQPYSKQRAQWRGTRCQGAADVNVSSPQNGGLFFGLERRAEDLRQRIEDRVDRMFERGLVAETERLLSQGLDKNRTAQQAIGYKQVTEYMRGERSLAETKELVKVRTRQFAKRQRTWFRRQLAIDWVLIGDGDDADTVTDQLLVRLHREREQN